MTISAASASDLRTQYTGSGTTGPFTTPKFLLSSDLVVVRTDGEGADSTLVENSDYTISGGGDYTTGSLTLTSALLAAVGDDDAEILTIYNDPPINQLVELSNNSAFPADQLEAEGLDRLCVISQRISYRVDRSVTLIETASDPAGPITMPDLSGNAGYVLSVNSGETGFEFSASVTDIATASTSASAAASSASAAASSAAAAAASAASVLSVTGSPSSGQTIQWDGADWVPADFVLSDGDYGDVTVSSSGTAIAVDSGAITYAKMASAAIAADADIWAGTASKLVDAAGVISAGAVETLTDASSISWDLEDGVHFAVTLGGNRTLSNPSNPKVGRSGVIEVVQDGTGSRTLSYDTWFEFAAGTAPVLTTDASASDLLTYYVASTTRIIIFQAALDVS